MKVVLLTGASGFIGSRLANGLLAAGHRVIGTARRTSALPAGVEPLEADFSRDVDPAIWRTRLHGVDVAINAVGIIRQRHPGEFAAVHSAAPSALFTACATGGVPRVVQISALGADAGARSEYHLSKHAADEALRALPLQAAIVQPSLVFGPEGASSRSLLALVSLPVLGLATRAAQAPVQPVHVQDLVDAVVRIVEAPDVSPGAVTIAAVGPRPMPFVEYLQTLRVGLGLPPAPVIPVPRAIVAAGARLTAGPEALAMLERGNAAPAADLARVLGRVPLDAAAFVPPNLAPLLLTRARVDLCLPLLLAALAVLWLGTAALSFGLYPRTQSYALLGSIGVTGAWQPLLLNLGAALDALLGLGILLRPRWRAVWLAQIGLMLGYTGLLTWRAPAWWLHPFGPVLKNVPLIAATLLVLALIPPAARKSP